MKNETIIKMIMWVWDGVDPAKHVISAHNIKHIISNTISNTLWNIISNSLYEMLLI